MIVQLNEIKLYAFLYEDSLTDLFAEITRTCERVFFFFFF